MPNESRQWLYNTLKKEGYNVGENYEKFDSLLTNNPDSRKWVYDTATGLGYNLGKDYAQFESIIQPAPAQTQQPPAPAGWMRRVANTVSRSFADPGQQQAATLASQTTDKDEDDAVLSAAQKNVNQPVGKPTGTVAPKFFRDAVGKMREAMTGEPYVSDEEQKAFGEEIRTRLMARATPEQRRQMLEQQYGEEINKEFDKQLAEQYDEQTISRNKKQVDKMHQDYLKENLDYLDEQYQPQLEDVRQLEKDEEEQRKQQLAEYRRLHPEHDPELLRRIEEAYAGVTSPEGLANKQKEIDYLRLTGIETRLADAKAREEELKNMRDSVLEEQNKGNGDGGTWSRFNAGYNAQYTLKPADTPEVQYYDAAIRQKQAEIRTISAELNDAGFLQGVIDAAVDPSFWTMGLSDLSTAMSLQRIKNSIDNGEELTSAQRALLDATVAKREAEEAYAGNRGFWYNAADITVNAVPFVGEFIATGGGLNVLTVAGKSAGKALAKHVTSNLAKKAVQYTGTALGDIAAGFTMANTTGAARTWADIEQRYLGQVQKTDDGYEFVGGEDWGDAVFHGQVANTLEYYTEKLGDHLGVLGKGAAWAGRKTGLTKTFAKGMDKLGLSKISPVLSRIKASDFYQRGNALLKRGGVHELPSEIMEEEANILLNSALVGDNKFSDLWDMEKQLDLIGGLAVSVGFMRALPIVSGAAQTAQYYRYKHKTDVADTVAKFRLTEGRWAPIKERIDNTENKDMSQVMTEILRDPDLEHEEKKAIADYAFDLFKLRGFNLATMAKAKDRIEKEGTGEEDPANVEAAVDDATTRGYQQGYQAESAAIRKQYADEASAAAERVKTLFDDADQEVVFGNALTPEENIRHFLLHRGEYTDEQITALADYYQKQTRVDGMIDAADNAVNLQVQNENAKVRSNTHQGTEQVITARRGDEDVYVVGGDVVISPAAEPQGAVGASEVVLMGTGGAVVVKNAQTGEVSVVSPQELTLTGAQDAQAMIDNNEKALRKRLTQLNEDDMTYGEPADIGFKQDDEVTLRDAEGNVIEGTIAMRPNTADGAYVVQTNDGRAVEFTNEQLNRMVVTYNGQAVDHGGLADDAAAVPQPTEQQSGVQDNAGGEAGVNSDTGGNEPSAAASETPAGRTDPGQTVAEATGTVADTEAMPMIGDGEDAEPDFSRATSERAHSYIYDEAGLTREEADQFVDANKKEADKALEKLTSKPPKVGPSLAKYRKEKAEWQQNVEAARQRASYWQEVKDRQAVAMKAEQEAAFEAQQQEAEGRRQLLEDQRTQQEKMAVAKRMYGDALDDDLTFAHDVMELVALNMPRNLAWDDVTRGEHTYRGLQKELGLKRGWGKRGDTTAFNSYLAKKGHGIGIESAVDALWRSDMNSMANDEKRFEYNDIKDALLRLLTSAQSPSDIRDYVVNSRVAQAEAVRAAEDEAARDAEMQAWAEHYHLTPDERETFEEWLQQPPTDIEEEIINQIIADNEQNRTSRSLGQEPEQGRTGAEAGRGESQVRGPESNQQEGEVNYGGSGTAEAEVYSSGQVVPDNAVAGRASGGKGISGAKNIILDPRTIEDEEKKKRGNLLRNALAIDVESNQIKSSEGVSARKAAENWWDENVPEPLFYDTEVGEVEINRNSVESSLAHRYSQAKLDAITSLPDGFENAVYLGTMPDANRQEGVVNHYFAYPINYNGKRCYVFCRALHDNNTNRLYVHEVFVEENIKKGDTLQTAASQPHGGIALYRDILANVLDSSSEGKVTENISTDQGKEGKTSIQGTDYSEEEILNVIRGDLEIMLEEAGLEDVFIKGMAVHGSRKRGDARDDSDLDVVVEYEGDISEDGLFNLFNENPIVIDGLRVDVNPITKGKSGTLEQYMKRSRQYDEEKKTLGKTSSAEEIAEEEAKVNTNPTEGQKEAGNYQKGHIKVNGLDISIENPKSSIRRGTDADGNEWETTMHNTYGYIRGTTGADKDHIDVFLSDDPTRSNKVFIVQQRKKVNGTWKFDELKVLLGFDDAAQASNAYLSNYKKGWDGMSALIETDMESFKEWLKNGNQKGTYKEDGTWAKIYPGVSTMVADEGEMPEPEQQEVQILRWKGDNRLSGMGGELSEVPGGHGQTSTPQSDSGQNRREQGLLQGELQVDGLDNTIPEPKGSPLSDLQRQNDVNATVGRGNGASARENKIQNPDVPLERRENTGNSRRNQGQLQNDNISGQNNENGGLGEGTQSELQNAEEQTETGLANGKNSRNSNEHIAQPIGKTSLKPANGENTLNHQDVYAENDGKGLPLQRTPVKSWDDKEGNHHEGLEEELERLEHLISADTADTDSSGGGGRSNHNAVASVEGVEAVPVEESQHETVVGERERKDGSHNRQLRRRAALIRAEISRRERSKEDLRNKYNINKKGDITLDDLARMFRDLNGDPVIGSLFERVYETMKRLKLDFRFTGHLRGGVNGSAITPYNITFYDWDALTRGSDNQEKARILLHEMIHNVTSQALLFSRHMPHLLSLTSKQFRAARKLAAIYKQVKEANPKRANGKDFYGLTNVDEMVAELANPEFRQALEQIEVDGRSLWQRIKDAIRDFFGLGSEEVAESNALKEAGDALEEILDSYGLFNTIRHNTPRQILEAGQRLFGDGTSLVDDMEDDFARRKSNALAKEDIFVSNAMKAVEDIKQAKATPEQWLAMIQKAGGLKAGEDKWLGLSEWLASPSPSEGGENKPRAITKQEVLDFIKKNQIEIDEDTYTEHPQGFEELKREYDQWLHDEGYDYAWEQLRERFGDDAEIAFGDMGGELTIDNGEAASVLLGSEKPINGTRLDYTTDGLENKKEIALVVPTIEPWNESDEIHFGDAGEGRAVAWVRFGDTSIPVKEKVYKHADEFEEPWDNGRGSVVYWPKGMKNGKDYIVYGKTRNGDYRYGVFIGEAGIGTWETFDEAKENMNTYYQNHPKTQTTGHQKVLVIDEIQSKRHQEGREKGYKKILGDDVSDAYDKFKSLEEDLMRKYDEMKYAESEDDIKSILPDEVYQHYISARQHYLDVRRAERDNNNAIPDAPFEKNWHELAMKRMLRYAAENGYDMVAWTKGEQQAERYNIGKKVARITVQKVSSPDGVPAYRVTTWGNDGRSIGEASGVMDQNRMTELFGKELSSRMMDAAEKSPDPPAVIEGDGLMIGGEGMKGFYDQMLPRFMDKYGKKWGVKTGEVELPGLDGTTAEQPLTMWSVDVTPEMRESVMEGQPMFREAEEVTQPANETKRTPKQERSRQAFAERQWRRAHERASDWMKKLGLTGKMTVVDSVDELPGADKFSDNKRRSRGWYDPVTDSIVIILGNHRTPEDVVKTILHESVAHYGLRKLFGDRFDTFLDNAYNSAHSSIQEEIDKLSEKYGNDTRKATEEYLARLAEDTDFENAENKPWLRHWFNQIKEWFLNMLKELGLPGYEENLIELTDNELRYLLWRSYKNLSEPGRYRNVFQAARDIQMQQQLGVGRFDRSRDSKESQQESGNGEEMGKAADAREVRFYDGVEKVNEQFNKELSMLTEENADKITFNLGIPSAILVSAGVEDKPLKLYGNKVVKKMKKHGFVLEDLRDLPMAVADPIAVFDNYRKAGNRSVLTELKTARGNFLVAIDLGKGHDVDFNVIPSVFGKERENIVDWINKGYATYINKEKALEYLHHSALRAVTSDSKASSQDWLPMASPEEASATQQELDSAAKIVENFENPKLFEENFDEEEENELFREGEERPEDEAANVARRLYEDAVRDTGDRMMISALIRSVGNNENWTRFKHKFAESYFDYSRSIKALQDAIEKGTGKTIKGFEDVWRALNSKSSIDSVELRKVMYDYIAPMTEFIGDMIKGKEIDGRRMELDDVEKYMNAVHGLERNPAMAMKQAQDEYDEDVRMLKQQIENGDLTDKERNSLNVRLLIKEARFKGIKNYMDNKDVEKWYNSWKRELEYDRRSGTISEKDYEKKLKQMEEEYEHGWQYKYRGQDYSGLTALFEDEFDGEEKPTEEQLEQAARDYAAKFEEIVGKDSADGLWKYVKALNSYSLRKSYESGLLSKEQYQNTLSMYDHYVPLRGWHDDYAGDVYQYISRGEPAEVLQGVLKKAYGRKSRAARILGTMAAMANTAIVQGNKNLVAQRLLNMAMNHGDSGLLMVGEQYYQKTADGDLIPLQPKLRDNMSADEMREELERFEEQMKAGEDTGNVVTVKKKFKKEMPLHMAKWQERQHCVRVMRGGKEYLVYILGNPRATEAFNGLLNPHGDPKFWNVWMRFMRHLAKYQTSLSPEFLMSNFERDVTTASASAYIKYGEDYRRQFAGNLARIMPLTRAMIRKTKGRKVDNIGGIFSLLRKFDAGTLDMDNETERLFDEFVNFGGMTGISYITKSEEYQASMQEIVNRMRPGKLGKVRNGLEAFGDAVEFLNKGIENATRFATYMTSRQRGRSVRESIFDAKEASVNFNMKGSGAWGNMLARRLYLYMNVSMQALRMLGSWYANDPQVAVRKGGAMVAKAVGKRFLKAAVMTYVASVLTAVVNSLLSELLGRGGGDDDDDKKSDWWALSEWNRYNFVNAISPFSKGYFHWSLPQELRPIWALGQITVDMVTERMTWQRGVHSMAMQMNNLSPISFLEGGTDSDESIISSELRALTPSVISPFTNVYLWNRDFMGHKITNQGPWNKNVPEWKRAGEDTPGVLISGSRKWNELTGGRQNSKGWGDSPYLNPSSLYYIGTQYFGGLGSMANRLFNLVDQATDPEQEVELRNIPFLSKIYVPTGDDYSKDRVMNEKFWMYWDEFNAANDELGKDSRQVEAGEMSQADADKTIKARKADGSYRTWKIIKDNALDYVFDKVRGTEMEKEIKQMVLDAVENGKAPDWLDRVERGGDNYKTWVEALNRQRKAHAESLSTEEAAKEFDESGDAYMRQALATKLAHDAGASKDSYGGKPEGLNSTYYYQLNRTAEDVIEDSKLYALQERARNAGDDELKKQLEADRKRVHSDAVYLNGGRADSIWMDGIRKQRHRLMKQHDIPYKDSE